MQLFPWTGPFDIDASGTELLAVVPVTVRACRSQLSEPCVPLLC
jgi:hypothetical protein